MFGPIKFDTVVDIKPLINVTRDRTFKSKNIPVVADDN